MKRTLLQILIGTVACLALVLFIGCEEDEDIDVVYDNYNIEQVISRATATDANPEIVRMVPGSDNQAVFVSSGASRITLIDYTATNFTFGTVYSLDPGSATAEMTSIDVSPQINGENYVAVCVAEVDCAKGSVLLVRLSDGEIVATVEIGYNPDGTAFTKDGTFLIVACEDDREDRPCKPDDRWGGSIAIVDLRNGIANATLSQDFLVDWAEDSEPEHCETSDDGTVICSVQETSQIVIFNTADLPLTDDNITIVDLPDNGAGIAAEPDGLFISPDGTMALISNEENGTFLLLSLPDGAVIGGPVIIEDDLPEGWQVDDRKTKKRTEPEECTLVEKTGHLYAILALQESHAVVVYDVTDPANPVFDSIAAAGVDYENDNGMEASEIGSEGLSAHPSNGVVFSANEREGSISMFRAQWTGK